MKFMNLLKIFKGYKAYSGGIITMLSGVTGILAGGQRIVDGDIEAGVTLITEGAAIVGVGLGVVGLRNNQTGD